MMVGISLAISYQIVRLNERRANDTACDIFKDLHQLLHVFQILSLAHSQVRRNSDNRRNGLVRRYLPCRKPSPHSFTDPTEHQSNTTFPNNPKTPPRNRPGVLIFPRSFLPSNTSIPATSPILTRSRSPAMSQRLSEHWEKRSRGCKCTGVGRDRWMG